MAADVQHEEILREIEGHRRAIAELEAKVAAGAGQARGWPPTGFYTTFYLVAGLTLGTMGALTSFVFNVVGSLIVAQDPMLILRVFGTFFIGQDALTTDNLNFLILVLLTHLIVGAVGGAVFHVIINRKFADRSTGQKILSSALFGCALWLINFYGIISWLQPLLVGQAYILRLMPLWVAALTHIIYGLTLGLLQPIGRFVPYAPPTS
ncbi:MAG: hypothetical protein HYW08_17795 [candidate division NC10 bacterium]|nr:hypothetical protein [candidate division NC10 bacterium]